MSGGNIEKYNESLTKEERIERASKAGIASGIARAKRREIKDSLSAILGMAMKSGEMADIEEIKSLADIKGKNLSVMDAGAIAMVQRWLKGDMRAGEMIIELIGQKPASKVVLDGEINNPFSGLTTEELKKMVNDE